MNSSTITANPRSPKTSLMSPNVLGSSLSSQRSSWTLNGASGSTSGTLRGGRPFARPGQRLGPRPARRAASPSEPAVAANDDLDFTDIELAAVDEHAVEAGFALWEGPTTTCPDAVGVSQTGVVGTGRVRVLRCQPMVDAHHRGAELSPATGRAGRPAHRRRPASSLRCGCGGRRPGRRPARPGGDASLRPAPGQCGRSHDRAVGYRKHRAAFPPPTHSGPTSAQPPSTSPVNSASTCPGHQRIQRPVRPNTRHHQHSINSNRSTRVVGHASVQKHSAQNAEFGVP